MSYKCVLDSISKVVVNIIMLEDGAEWTPPEGQELAPQHNANIGDTWDGEKFIPPIHVQEYIESLSNSGAEPDVIA